MKLQLFNKNVLDEREEQLTNKAGAETAQLLLTVLSGMSMAGAFFSSDFSFSIPIIMAIVVLSILFYSIRCAQIGVRSSNTAYLNFWGVLLVTLLLALVIWIGNYQKFHSIYSGPFDPYFLSVLPITFLFNLPLVAGLNAILIFLSKIEKKRYEAELERLENEE